MNDPLPFARSFRDLIVYQRALELQRRVFETTRGFPREEAFALTDQIRRASRSIGARLAEAWAKRDYERHFLSKLTDADGEQMETQHWLTTSVDSGYLTPEEGRVLYALCLEIGRMLSTMKRRASEFCPNPHTAVVRETPADFFAPAPEPFC